MAELLVAMVVLVVGLLGLFETLSVAMRRNVENDLRQKAVAVAEDTLNTLKAQPFSNVSSPVPVVMSGGAVKNISVETQVDDFVPTGAISRSKKISVRVSWSYRGRYYEHQTASAVGN